MEAEPPEDRIMEPSELFTNDTVNLHLTGKTKTEVLGQLVSLLRLDERRTGILYSTLQRREKLGSTGMGRGIAIPHCRSLVVSRLRLAYGRSLRGVDFEAIDDAPVHNFFLIVAPPLEISNQYLSVLGKIAQFAKGEGVPELLAELEEPEDFLRLVFERAH